MVSTGDIIEFLESHREELLILATLLDEEGGGPVDRDMIEKRIACIDALLQERRIADAPALGFELGPAGTS